MSCTIKIAPWCNGNTQVFGTCISRSNRGGATTMPLWRNGKRGGLKIHYQLNGLPVRIRPKAQPTGRVPGNLIQSNMAKCKRKPDNETFHWVNVNPKGNSAGDCVVRAICSFLHWSWEKTYTELFEHGLKTGYLINDDENYQTFLSEKGYEKHRMPKRGDGTKYTAKEFCKEIAQPGHEYVLRLANHLTFIGPNRRICDTWDCGYKSVGNYWESENIGY